MKERFKELDALRGVAALLVVFFHFTSGRPEFNQFFKLGTTGVDLFFIISGFVIIMSLEHVAKGIDFVINRVSRLYPTYWVVVTFTFIIYLFRRGEILLPDVVNYFGNLTMFQFYLRLPNIDGPYWTMIIEMIFYILVLVLFKFKLLKRLNIIGVLICLITVILTQFFWSYPMVSFLVRGVPLLQFFPLFFAGTVFYKIYLNKQSGYLMYLIILFCLVCQLLLFSHAGRSWSIISHFQYGVMLSTYFLIFILFVNNGLKFIVNKVTLFLGKISYALYLVHQYISLAVIIPFFYNKIGLNFWLVCVFINLPIIIGIAAFITYKIEIPYSQKMKKALLGYAQKA
jgi:peptidoglycan/LPS O-acetylase OafA/YrhL